MAKKFKIGDTVRICNLTHSTGWTFIGNVGDEGKIIAIEAGCGSFEGTVFYELYPYYKGKCWPAECLEMVKPAEPAKVKKIKGTLFSMDDL